MEGMKREVKVEQKKGMGIQEIILVAVLLAAGLVLKLTVGTFVNLAGMKPNFVIAMYCLAIYLIKPKLYEAAIIGLLAGAICQIMPGTPYLNFLSELVGAVAMGLLVKLPLSIKKFSLTTSLGTFISTVLSGTTFVLGKLIIFQVELSTLAVYIPIVLSTALINTIIVQVLALPLERILKKGPAEAKA